MVLAFGPIALGAPTLTAKRTRRFIILVGLPGSSGRERESMGRAAAERRRAQ